MMLEEELEFSNHEEAQEFIKYIRSLGCNPKMSVQNRLIHEPTFRGRIGALLSLAEEEAATLEGDSEQEDIREAFLALSRSIERRMQDLAAFLNEHQVGDIVPVFPDEETMAKFVADIISGDEEKAFSQEDRDKVLAAVGTNTVIEENNLFEDTPEGRRLVRTIEPEEAYIIIPEYPLCGIDEEKLQEKGVTVAFNVIGERGYLVSTGPEIVLVEDIGALSERLQAMGVEEETCAGVQSSLLFKRLIVDRIMAVLDEQGKLKREEILDFAGAFDAQISDEGDRVSFLLDDEILDDILADLRKVGLISGKDSKINAAKAK
jgi:hypothetical protein